MRLLVDTCTFLWLAADDPSLSAAAKDACTDPAHDVFLSGISAWEIAIKCRLGRLPLPEPPQAWVRSRRIALELDALPFDEQAACHTYLLPPHHNDPFDRALIAQALVHGMTLATPDDAIARYPVPTLW